MATTQSFNMNANALTQIWNFPKLKGQENYQPWSKKMRSALKYSGLWEVVDQGISSFPEDPPTDPAPTVAEAAAYELAVKNWKNLNNQAAELIYSMCDEKPAEAIEDDDVAINRWIKLQTDYSDSGFVLRFTKLQELWTTTLPTSGNSIKTYIANIRTKAKDLKRMGAAIDDWILVALLLNNLDTKYKDFVHRLVTQLDDMPDFDKIVTLLYEEDRLLKKGVREQAMAASLKRFNKEHEEKKNSRSGNDSGRGGKSSGRGRGNNNNTNDRASKNPNSSNYKGDGEAPECSKCTPLANGTKKKHWPLDCWTLHPEKMPERLKNKPKANVANSDRPDDFVDNNSQPHISAMAHLICEEENDADESYELYWGLEAASPTPKCGGGAAFEMDAANLSLQENMETKSLTQSHLAGDASQEIIGSPLLPEEGTTTLEIPTLD